MQRGTCPVFKTWQVLFYADLRGLRDPEVRSCNPATAGGGLVNTRVGDPAMYVYGDPAHVHAVTAVSGLGTYTQTFDPENRLVSVAVSGGGGTTQYQYDAGQMVKKIAPDGTVTVYLGVVEYEISSGSTETTSYYNVPGARVVRVNSTLSYVLTDHLGSSNVTLDDGGGIDGELRYYAYGETRVSSGSTPTEKRYTGQTEHADVGLYYYSARWYHAELARFLSADTVIPEPGNPQALNRYSYSLSNPLKYSDPTGHLPHCVSGCGSVPALPVYGDITSTDRFFVAPKFSAGAEFRISLNLNIGAVADTAIAVSNYAQDFSNTSLLAEIGAQASRIDYAIDADVSFSLRRLQPSCPSRIYLRRPCFTA
jgi:RHS repeat-associated protein